MGWPLRGAVFSAALAACTDLSGLSGSSSGTTAPPSDASVSDQAAPGDAEPAGDAFTPYDAPYDAPPIQAGYARVMHVMNPGNGALPAGYPACVVLAPSDLSDLVAANKVRADFADFRIAGPLTDRPRTLDALAQSRTELCFRLDRAIAAGATDDGYTLRYGDPNALPPTFAGPFVFDFYDGFDGTSLASRWTAVTPFGSPTVAGGVLKLPAGTPSAVTTVAGSDPIPVDASLELRVQVTNPVSDNDPGTGFYYWFGFQHVGDFVAAEPWTIFVARGKGSVQAEHKTSGAGTCSAGCEQVPAVAQTSNFQIYRVDRVGSNVKLTYQDGTSWTAQGSNGDMSVMLRNFLVTSDLFVDWVRARPLVAAEPTVTFDAEKTVP